MYSFIRDRFIPNHEKVEDADVRQRYGSVFSLFSILCNIIMVVFKLIVSYITNFVSIRADALNNLSDVGANIATLFGFKLSNKHPDADHPYGHGRMEYISGMIVSFLILLMGFEAAKESLFKIFNPQETSYSSVALLVLIVSICIKLVMADMNRKAGKEIDSETLLAAGQDSLNDSLMTGTTLVCLLIYRFTSINVDAYIGLLSSLMVLKSGIEIFKDVMDTILGKAPDHQLLKDIEKTICSHDEIIGIHDLMLHDYGPSNRFMSLHAEVDASKNIIDVHDTIDNIEKEIMEKFKILTTIHMDPIDANDELVNELRAEVKSAVRSINEKFDIHDFRIVQGPTHTNMVFDVLLPADDRSDAATLRKAIDDKVKEIDKTYETVIHFDHSYV